MCIMASISLTRTSRSALGMFRTLSPYAMFSCTVMLGNKRIALEHHAHIALLNRQVRHILIVEVHGTRIGRLQARNDAQGGRLATARGAKEGPASRRASM